MIIHYSFFISISSHISISFKLITSTSCRAPAFIIPLGEDGITLFCPLGMSCLEYKKALVRFDEFLSVNGKTHTHPQGDTKIISAETNVSTVHNDNRNENRNEYKNRNENENRNRNEIPCGVRFEGVRYGCSGQLHIKGEENELRIYPGCNPFDLYKEYSSLNQGQKEAVKKVLFAQDNVLVFPVPGSPKSKA